MALHPQIQQALKAMADAKLKAIEDMTPPEARAQMDAVAKARAQAFPPTEVGRLEERDIPGPAGPMRARFYWPKGVGGAIPAVLYFHGGGHVIGSLDSHDGTARNLCQGAGALIVSLDYRMGPEHRFPAAVEDSWTALQWLHANAAALGADPARLAVAGDSAGANLAAVVALMARDKGGPALRLQLLVYPVGDYNLTGESYQRYATGYGPLTRDAMVWFQRYYLNSVADADDWRASPLRAKSHAGVAPAFIVLAECDVLLDDGRRYAEALRRAGVPVQAKEYPGMIHAFFGMAPSVDVAVEAQADASAALKRAFA
jgi:acetyl esterase